MPCSGLLEDRSEDSSRLEASPARRAALPLRQAWRSHAPPRLVLHQTAAASCALRLRLICCAGRGIAASGCELAPGKACGAAAEEPRRGCSVCRLPPHGARRARERWGTRGPEGRELALRQAAQLAARCRLLPFFFQQRWGAGPKGVLAAVDGPAEWLFAISCTVLDMSSYNLWVTCVWFGGAAACLLLDHSAKRRLGYQEARAGGQAEVWAFVRTPAAERPADRRPGIVHMRAWSWDRWAGRAKIRMSGAPGAGGRQRLGRGGYGRARVSYTVNKQGTCAGLGLLASCMSHGSVTLRRQAL